MSVLHLDIQQLRIKKKAASAFYNHFIINQLELFRIYRIFHRSIIGIRTIQGIKNLPSYAARQKMFPIGKTHKGRNASESCSPAETLSFFCQKDLCPHSCCGNGSCNTGRPSAGDKDIRLFFNRDFPHKSNCFHRNPLLKYV